MLVFTDRIDLACRKAIEIWGRAAQIRMVQEECAELIAAINRLDRGRCSLDDVAEEVADVAIVLHQMTLLCGPELVAAKIAEKLARLEGRLSTYVAPEWDAGEGQG